MGDKFNLSNYREAKTILPDINSILKIITISLKAFGFYKTYIPVARIICVLEEQKELLEVHKTKFDKVLNSKGKLEHEQ